MAPTSPSDPPFVSVIVPVYDDEDRLRSCVESLLAQTYPADRFEVVVVDNASSRPVMLTGSRVGVHRELQRGSYAARNRGLAVARGEVIAFTDSDCKPSPTWLEEGVRVLQEDGVGMVGGRVEVFFTSDRSRRTAPELYEGCHAFPQEAYVARGFAATANMLTWRSVLDRVGHFDAALQSRGDVEWGQRAAASGVVQRFAPGAVVRHPARSSWSELMTKSARIAKGKCDVDAAQGRGRRHYAGLVLAQLRAVLRTAVAVWARPEPAGAVDKLRYLAAYASVRAVLARVMLGHVVRPRRPRAATQVPLGAAQELGSPSAT